MKLTELELQTAVPGLLLDFYRNILHMPVTGKEDHFILNAGFTRLHFIKTISKDKNPFYHFAFNIPSNKIEESLAWIKGKATPLSFERPGNYIADFRNWRAKSVYFIDPAGNILELIARFDLEDPEAEPFSPEQIRCVSEIGIVFPADTFEIDCDRFMTKYNLQYFDKQPPLPQFRAVGDDYGLFIVVPDKRNWYPTTDRPSGIFPLKTRFENEGKMKSFAQ